MFFLLIFFSFTSSFSAKSSPKSLIAGEKYYLEMLGCEIILGDFFMMDVELPDGTVVDPILYKYLESIPGS